MTEGIKITELEFRLLHDLIHEEFGIMLKDDQMSSLAFRLEPRLIGLGLPSFMEYYHHLKHGAGGEGETRKMIAALANGETYFFRELPQLVAFRDNVLPEIGRRKNADPDRKIRILSAGCSTGEEVYTLAMLIFEAGTFFWGWDVRVIGLDINEASIERARKAAYFPSSFRMTDPAYVRKFFSENSGDMLVKDSIRRLTSFVQGNINRRSTWDRMEPLDAIFCRNVMIYFSEQNFDAALENFYRALRPGGYLFLGHSESLAGKSTGFKPARVPGAIIYVKDDEAAP